MLGQMQMRLLDILAASMDSEVLATLFGAALAVSVWLAASHGIGVNIVEAIPPVIPLTSVPSIDCLMQQAHCLP